MNEVNVAKGILGSPNILEGSAARTSAAISDGVDEQVEITVTGAALGDYVLSTSYSIDTANINLIGNVTEAGIVTANFTNCTGASITLGAGTVRAIVIKRAGNN